MDVQIGERLVEQHQRRRRHETARERHALPLAAGKACGTAVAKTFQADISKEQFKGSPSYDRSQLANRDYAWDELSERYFNAAKADVGD